MQERASGQRVMIPALALDDPRLGSADLRTLNWLGRYADSATGWCHPKQRTLADGMGVTQQAVSASIRRLERFGWIEVEAQFHRKTGGRIHSRYRICWDYRPDSLRPSPPQPDIVGVGRESYQENTPQSDVVTQDDVVGVVQGEIVTPTTSEVVTPTTSEVVAIERPIRTSHRNVQPTEATPPPAVARDTSRSKRTTATTVPDDFEVTPKHLEYAQGYGLNEAQARAETEKFLAHHRFKGTRGVDWYAGWQNWIRNSVGRFAPTNGQRPIQQRQAQKVTHPDQTDYAAQARRLQEIAAEKTRQRMAESSAKFDALIAQGMTREEATEIVYPMPPKTLKVRVEKYT